MQSILAKPTYILIALSWVAFLLYWSISGTRVKPTGKARNWAVTILLIIAVLGLFWLLSFGIFPDIINTILWHGSLALDIGADIVVLMGLSIMIWARRTLGSNWSGNVAIAQDHELVQAGPYAYVRHPIYTGFLIMIIGTAMAYGRLLGIIILVICAAGFYIKSVQEESLLAKHFSGVYESYKAKTKAFIPFLL